MRKALILAAMLLCVSLVYSQEPIKFLGIDWGISQEKLIAEMVSRGFTDYFSLDDARIIFQGEIAGGDGIITLSTYKDKFYKVSILVQTYIHAKEIADLLSEKYGLPTGKNEDIVFVYKWEHGENGFLGIIEGSPYTSIDYSDGVITLQKKRDELAGL